MAQCVTRAKRCPRKDKLMATLYIKKYPIKMPNDVEIINRLDVGVHALDTVPLKTEKKGIGELNIAVTFGGVTFRPGEYVYADNNGVIVSKEKLLTTD